MPFLGSFEAWRSHGLVVPRGGWRLYRPRVGTGRAHYVANFLNINNVTAAAGIQMQRRIAGWAVLGLKFPNEFIKARLVGDVGAGELEDTFASKSVFQGLFAHGAFASDKCALSPRTASVYGARHHVVVDAANSSGIAADNGPDGAD